MALLQCHLVFLLRQVLPSSLLLHVSSSSFLSQKAKELPQQVSLKRALLLVLQSEDLQQKFVYRTQAQPPH